MLLAARSGTKELRAGQPRRRWRLGLGVIAGGLLGLAVSLAMAPGNQATAELRLDAGQDTDRPGEVFHLSISMRGQPAEKSAALANRLAEILAEEGGTLLGTDGQAMQLTLISEAKVPVTLSSHHLLAAGAMLLGLLLGLAAWRKDRPPARPAAEIRQRRWRHANEPAHSPAPASKAAVNLAAIRDDLREIRGALHDLADLRRRAR